jgi:hypothetical protein
MQAMQEIGKWLFLTGILLAGAGLLLWLLGGRVPIAKLPGDIVIHKGSFSFYFPLVTCILISLALTLILWLLRR